MIAVMAIFSLSAFGQQYTMHATKYHPGVGGLAWRTASGDRIDKQKLSNYEIRWVALSPDMFKQHGFKMGDTIVVKCERVPKLEGKWVVKDRMGARRKQCIDFLLPKGDNFGFNNPTKVIVEKLR